MASNLEQRFYRLVGRRIRAQREGRYTQEQLAELIGLSRTSVTNLEAGNQKFPLHILLRLADRLDCEASDLLPSWEELRTAAQTLSVVRPVEGEIPERTAEVIEKYQSAPRTDDEET